MAYLDEALPYIAAFITMAAGVIGFFWARSGERNAVGGIGWAALAFVIAAGLVTVVATFRKSRSAEAANDRAVLANAKAARLGEEARQLLIQQSVVTGSLFSGIDFRQPVASGTLYFEQFFSRDYDVIEPAGFVGPFPALARGGWGLMRLQIDAGISYSYFLTPAPRGETFLVSTAARRPSYRIEPAVGRLDQFLPVGRQVALERERERDGLWTSSEEPGGGYDLNIRTAAQFRRLISVLAKEPRYGSLVFSLPDASQAELNRVVEGFRAIRPVLGFSVQRPGDLAAPDQPCFIVFRFPMDVVHVRTRGQTLFFELRASAEGFRIPDICPEIQTQP